MMQRITTGLTVAATALLATAIILVVLLIANSVIVQDTHGQQNSPMLRRHQHQYAALEQDVITNNNYTTIMETIESIPSLYKFHEALEKANLLEVLRSDSDNGSLTVLMPINDAFDALSPDLSSKIFDTKWIIHLQEILLYHIHKGEEQAGGGVSATDMMELSNLEMENGESISITTSTSTMSSNNTNQDAFLFNTAQSIGYMEYANDNGGNDYSFMIDQVLMPSFITLSLLDVVASLSPLLSTSTFASLVVTAGLESTLNDPNVALTLLAPSNAAFAALDDTKLSYLQYTDAGLPILKKLVLYHVLPSLYPTSTFDEGSSQISTLNGNTVNVFRDGDTVVLLINGQDILTSPNHVANNGIVHVLKTVLIPPDVSLPTATTTTTTTTVGSNDDPATTTIVGSNDDPPPAITTDPTDPSNMMTATLVNVVSETSNLSYLRKAIAAVGDLFHDELNGSGPYTMFAPNDAAFNMFPTVQDLYMSPDSGSSSWILHLHQVLKFHVTQTSITSLDDWNTNNENEWIIPMLNGENVMVTKTNNRDDAILLSPAVMGTATLSDVEITAINGKAHVINRILLPSFVFTSMLERALDSNPALTALVEDPDLGSFVEYLNSNPGITFFAPSHAALSAMGELGDVTMEDLFFYHTVEMVLPSTSISPGSTRTVRSAQGGDLTISKLSNGDLLVNGVAVVSNPDYLARDGIVHVIDRVLTIPETSTTTTTTTGGQPVSQPIQEPTNTHTITSALCSSNPQCSSLNLGGDCCPTAEGIMLHCCFSTTTTTTTTTTQEQQKEQGSDNVTPNYVQVITTSDETSSCSSHTGCAGLTGDCCPSADNVYLDCCDSYL